VLEQGWTVTAAAGVSVRCARKWVSRYRAAGEAGLVDRSSAPKHVANRTAPERVAVIVALRQLRMTAAEIAETLAMPLSTVSVVLKRSGMGRLGRIGLEPSIRYEWSRPGELVHIDIKKLARIKGGAGWRVRGGAQHYNSTFHDLAGRRRRTVGYEYVHVAVDDYSRLAYAEVLPDEKSILSNRLPAARACFLSPPRRQGRTDTDRQRPLLPRRHARGRLPPARDTTHPHPSLPAADKRESRALHSHPALRLGLRRNLRLKSRTHTRP